MTRNNGAWPTPDGQHAYALNATGGLYSGERTLPARARWLAEQLSQ